MNITKLLAGGCIVLAFWLWWVIDDYDKLSQDYNTAANQLSEQKSLIAKQLFEFNRFNQISTTASRYGITTDANSEKRIIEYRKILQKEPTCDLYIPDDIANRLYNYTQSLRTHAMYTDTGSVNPANDSTTTTRGITYCQAVPWIDRLITTIDKGNERFRAIRKIEQQRASG